VTKLHEEFLRGTAAELAVVLKARPAVKGEITLIVGRPDAPAGDGRPLGEAVEEMVRSGTPRMDAIKAVARRRGLSKREVYRALQSG